MAWMRLRTVAGHTMDMMEQSSADQERPSDTGGCGLEDDGLTSFMFVLLHVTLHVPSLICRFVA